MTTRLPVQIVLLCVAMLGCNSGSTPTQTDQFGKNVEQSSENAKQSPKVLKQSRENAKQSGENLRKLTIAVLNYDSAKNEFPLRALKTKDGKPGLSWRVAILPFLNEEALYKEFHLDEPWDSPHNKLLVQEMPAVFKSPMSETDMGVTNYLGLETPDSAFNPDRGAKHAGFARDGTRNTILLLEVNDDRAIPWTKPGDYAPDSANPMSGLGKLHPKGGFLASMVSGDVHFLQTSIDPQIFRALCTARGNEVIDWDAIKP